MSRLKILIIGFGGRNAIVSGPGVYRNLLLPQLKALGNEVSIALLGFCRGVQAEADSLRRSGFLCEAIPLESHPYDDDRARALLAIIANFQPDLVWLDNVAVAWEIVPHLRGRGIASIGVIHSDDAFHHALWQTAVNSNFIPDSVIGVSQKLHRDVQTAIPASYEALYLPYGITLPDKVAKFSQPFRIIYVGRIEIEQKRLDQLTRLLIRATTEIPGMEAVIFGAGSWQTSLQKMLTQEVGHRVKFKGVLKRADLAQELQRAHAFALWSEYEGTPIAVLEAMASGVVPVCRRIESGLPELFGANESGFLVDSEDEFIQTVRALASDQTLWQTHSEAAWTKARLYSADANAQQVHELALRTLGRVRGRPKSPVENGLPASLVPLLPPVDPTFARFERRRPAWPFSLLGYARMRVAAWRRRKGNIL